MLPTVIDKRRAYMPTWCDTELCELTKAKKHAISDARVSVKVLNLRCELQQTKSNPITATKNPEKAYEWIVKECQ